MIKTHPKIAITFKDKEYSYSELFQYSLCYSQQMFTDDAPKKLMIFADNSPEWIFAFCAGIRRHNIVIPVDVQSTPRELAYIIDDCRPDTIFISSNKRSTIEQTKLLSQFQDFNLLEANDIDTAGVRELPVSEIADPDFEKTMLIIYTSGTTGTPKGVMLSYKNVLFNINAVSKEVPIFRPDTNIMVLLPLHHAFPLIGTVIAPLYIGATLHIAEEMNAESILKTLAKGKISIIVGVPRLYDMLAKGILEKINASILTKGIYKIMKTLSWSALSKIVFRSVHEKFGGHVQYLVSGGAALSDETAALFKALGLYVLDGYGMTETAPMISFTRPGKRKIGYVGDLLPGIQAKFEENGELCVKGDNVMQGYYNRPEETAEIIRDGWLHTGDVGFLDKHGLRLTGRIKEIIVTGNGKNINPQLLENELLAMSAFVKEVGVYLHNGILKAMLVPNLKEIRDKSIENMDEIIKNEILKFNTQVAPYKRIKQFLITSEELPKTRLGKIQRFRLAEMESKLSNGQKKVDNEPHSKIYLRLKSFVEAETNMTACANDHFEIDLAMDSLSRVALLTYIENCFEIHLNEEQLEQLSTLKLLSEYVEKQSNTINEKKINWGDILKCKIKEIKLPKPGFTQFISQLACKMLLFILYRFKGKGVRNIPKESCIIVANHRSSIDGAVITSWMQRKLVKKTFFFAKEKHWRSPFARFMARKNNIIVMDINKNLRESLQQMASVLKKGKNVIIFPEGTRSKDGTMKKFKETFAILSQELLVPVVPVAITGSESAFYKHIKLPRLNSRIEVDFLKPIYPNKNSSVSSIISDAAKVIQNKLSEHKANLNKRNRKNR